MKRRVKLKILIFSGVAFLTFALLPLLYFGANLKVAADTYIRSAQNFLKGEKNVYQNNETEGQKTDILSDEAIEKIEIIVKKERKEEKKKLNGVFNKLKQRAGELEQRIESEETRLAARGVFSPLSSKDLYIDIDISEQRLRLVKKGKVIASYLCSTGTYSMPTPLGVFHINSKSALTYSAPYGLYMPYWMAFIGSSYGIHELPYWPGGYREGSDHLGRRVSHGCVRLGIGPAAQVYSMVSVGTMVYIHS